MIAQTTCMSACVHMCACAHRHTHMHAPPPPHTQPELFLLCWRLVLPPSSHPGIQWLFSFCLQYYGVLRLPPPPPFQRTRKPNQEGVILPRDTEEGKAQLVSGGREKVRSLITQVKLTPTPNPHTGFPLTSETFPSKPPTPKAVSGPRWIGEAPPPTAGSGSRGVQDCGLL